ncbi:hypothetical protein BDW60DRAFT_175507 [Aspergillus nidulans var. acristatus]
MSDSMQRFRNNYQRGFGMRLYRAFPRKALDFNMEGVTAVLMTENERAWSINRW